MNMNVLTGESDADHTNFQANDPEGVHTAPNRSVTEKRTAFDDLFFSYWIRLSERQQQDLFETVKDLVDGEDFVLTDAQLKEVEAIRKGMLAGDKTYSVDEARSMLRNPDQRKALLH